MFSLQLQDYTKYEVCVLVGAGIGVTPFASIIQSLNIRFQDPIFEEIMLRDQEGVVPEWLNAAVAFKTRHVHFFWIVRELEMYSWFEAIIDNIYKSNKASSRITFHLFYTGKEEKDTTVTLPFVCGRPDWRVELATIGAAHSGKDIGIYLCGPKAIKKELSVVCREQTTIARKGRTKAARMHLLAESF